jgi:hypothetical protein
LADGSKGGGKPFRRGHLYRILTNPLYLGQIQHKGTLHQGQHPAIIERPVWEEVQTQLSIQTQRRRIGIGKSAPSLLAGLIRDEAGHRLTPSHAVKSGRRYRYYVSNTLIQGKRSQNLESLRVPAPEIETLVQDTLKQHLSNATNLESILG